MTTSPTLYLLAGGNGAGKSTFYRQQLAPHDIVFVNADEIAKLLDNGNSKSRDQIAWELANKQRDQLLEQGKTFAYETVFSHHSKLDVIRDAQAGGHHVTVIYIHLSDPQLNVARVKNGYQAAERHDVPEEKIVERLKRVPGHLKKAIELADDAIVYDNSSADEPFVLVAQYEAGVLVKGETPPWLI
ncbi:MAG: AAA family ATPase [Gammaproteobacteria bacterium]|nr:AAA family ATPase [Gammaproteobacteria bacterium]